MALISMTKEERLAFVDWRNPQYQGAFSCRRDSNYWTWIPAIGLVPAFSSTAQNPQWLVQKENRRG